MRKKNEHGYPGIMYDKEVRYKVNKKAISIITAVIMSTVLTVPALAASPSTTTVMNNPVSVPASVTTAKGYTLTEEESKATAVTAEKAVALSQGVEAEVVTALPDGVTFGSVTAQPVYISMANADILKNTAVQTRLNKLGIGTSAEQIPAVVRAGQLVFSNAAAGTYTVKLSIAGITSSKGVAIMVYVPGEVQPRVIRPRYKNGKLQAKLPVPCEYNVVTNVPVVAAAPAKTGAQ